MAKRLRLEDRQATDLLLDRIAAFGGQKEHDLYAGPHAGLRPRVQRLGHLLGVLKAAPAADPPRDLVWRTLERVALAEQTQAQVMQLSHHAGPVV